MCHATDGWDVKIWITLECFIFQWLCTLLLLFIFRRNLITASRSLCPFPVMDSSTITFTHALAIIHEYTRILIWVQTLSSTILFVCVCVCECGTFNVIFIYTIFTTDFSGSHSTSKLLGQLYRYSGYLTNIQFCFRIIHWILMRGHHQRNLKIFHMNNTSLLKDILWN